MCRAGRTRGNNYTGATAAGGGDEVRVYEPDEQLRGEERNVHDAQRLAGYRGGLLRCQEELGCARDSGRSDWW